MSELDPNALAGTSDTLARAARGGFILLAVLAAFTIGMILFRKSRNKAPKKPSYNQTAFAGNCFGILYPAANDEAPYITVFDKDGKPMSTIPQDEDVQFLGLTEENNLLMLYATNLTEMETVKFVFDIDELTFKEV